MMKTNLILNKSFVLGHPLFFVQHRMHFPILGRSVGLKKKITRILGIGGPGTLGRH